MFSSEIEEATPFSDATPLPPTDPIEAYAPFPHGLSLELALNADLPLNDILSAYRLTPIEFRAILKNPLFRQEYDNYKEELKKEGWSFRQKAKAQSEILLKTAWDIAQSPQSPSNIRLEAIKSIVKWAGLDTPPPPPGQANTQMVSFGGAEIPQAMLDQLKAMPDSEMEARVTQILLRRTSPTPPKDFIDIEAERLTAPQRDDD